MKLQRTSLALFCLVFIAIVVEVESHQIDPKAFLKQQLPMALENYLIDDIVGDDENQFFNNNNNNELNPMVPHGAANGHDQLNFLAGRRRRR